MNIIWSPESLYDLKSVRSHIARDDVHSADQVIVAIVQYTEGQLTQFPKSGRMGRVLDTYELPVPKLPYVIPYRIRGETIDIVRVYHTSRLWPERF